MSLHEEYGSFVVPPQDDIDMTFSVRPLTAEELAGPLMDQALAVFAGALGFPKRHARVTSFAGTLSRHALYGGFRAFGAFNAGGKLVGFSYGYTTLPGRWWRQTIAPPLTPHDPEYWPPHPPPPPPSPLPP